MAPAILTLFFLDQARREIKRRLNLCESRQREGASKRHQGEVEEEPGEEGQEPDQERGRAQEATAETPLRRERFGGLGFAVHGGLA